MGGGNLRALTVFITALAVFVAAASISVADGESSTEVVNSGILVPVTENDIHILDQRIDVVLPKPPGKGRNSGR